MGNWKRVTGATLNELVQGRSYIAAILYGHEDLVSEEVIVTSEGWLHKEGVELFDDSQVIFYMEMPEAPDLPNDA